MVKPNRDDGIDLGASSFEWKDLYIDGTANIDTLVSDVSQTLSGTTNIGSADSDRLVINAEIDILDMVDPTAQTAGIGTVFLDSADDALNIIHSDSSVVNLETGAETTLWTTDHDAAGNTLILDDDGDSSIASTSDDTVVIATGSSAAMTLTNSGVSVSGTFAVIGSSTTLGSSGTDLVTINGDIGGDLNPRDSGGAGQYDIGGAADADNWRHGYFDGTVTMDKIAADDGSTISCLHDFDYASGKYPILNTGNTPSGNAVELPLNGGGETACEGFVLVKIPGGAIKKLAYWS